MQAIAAPIVANAAPIVAADEDGLYVLPDHLKDRQTVAGSQNEIEDAGRWLAGIMEVPLGAEEKMDAIEQTEMAKRKLMDPHGRFLNPFFQEVLDGVGEAD